MAGSPTTRRIDTDDGDAIDRGDGVATDGGRGKNYCTYGAANLYDLLAEDPPTTQNSYGDTVPAAAEYRGLFVMRVGDSIQVQPEGYAGRIDGGDISVSEIDDVLQLVDELNSLHVEWSHYLDHEDLAARVERAGPKLTNDETKAADSELHLHVPGGHPRPESGSDDQEIGRGDGPRTDGGRELHPTSLDQPAVPESFQRGPLGTSQKLPPSDRTGDADDGPGPVALGVRSDGAVTVRQDGAEVVLNERADVELVQELLETAADQLRDLQERDDA
jgi:hypothetical protein